jgi:ribonuclease BN (tRNA processing enzyme)
MNGKHALFVALRGLAIVMGALAGLTLVPALAAPPPLELVVLGSGGPGAVGRAGSSHLILVDGVPRILADAGPGSFVRLGETGLPLEELDIVLLTHLHADHAAELPGIVKGRAVALRAPASFKIFGPEGAAPKRPFAFFPSTSQFVRLLFGEQGAFAYLPDFAGHIDFDVKDLPVRGMGAKVPATIYDSDGLVIRAVAGHHGDAPAVAYRVEHAGKSITYSGDMDAEGLGNLQVLAADTSLLVFNSAVLDPPAAPAILYTLHSPPAAIGHAARDSRAQSLILAHLSPATDRKRAEVEASIRQSFTGQITFAEDKLRIVP